MILGSQTSLTGARAMRAGHQECLLILGAVSMALAMSIGVGPKLFPGGGILYSVLGAVLVFSGMLGLAFLVGFPVAVLAKRKGARESFGQWWQIGSAWAFVLMQPAAVVGLLVIRLFIS